MCEEGDDEVGAEHGDCAGEEEGAVPLLLPHDVRQDGERHRQADGQRRHQAVLARRGVVGHLIRIIACGICRGSDKSQVRQCLDFCTADFWYSLAYESVKQYPKHCLT